MSNHVSGDVSAANCGSTSRLTPSLSRSTRNANSEPCSPSTTCCFQDPSTVPGFSHQLNWWLNNEQLTTSTWPSPLTSSGKSLKLSTKLFVKGRSRNRCWVHSGASYQF